MSDFLKTMAEASAARADLINTSFSSADLDLPLLPLSFSDFDVIAEIKDRSPAEGNLSTKSIDRVSRAKAYSDGGANVGRSQSLDPGAALHRAPLWRQRFAFSLPQPSV